MMEDIILHGAFERCIEIIGEASKNIPGDMKIKWSIIPWHKISGARNRIVHEYTGVNYHIIWDISVNILPDLKVKALEIINNPDL